MEEDRRRNNVDGRPSSDSVIADPRYDNENLSDNDLDKSIAEQPAVKFYSFRKYTVHHLIVFMLTFWSFALFHATRKTFSNVKTNVVKTWLPENLSDHTLEHDVETWNSHEVFMSLPQAESFLGIMDAVFMFCYAAGLYVSGILGDRFDPRVVLALGMWGTAIVNFLFGFVCEVTHWYRIPLFVILWIFNGFLQSSGWPAEVCIMGNWFGRGSRGLVLGIWSSCASVGNIVGAYLVSAVLPFGYEYAFLTNASLLFAGGWIVFCGLVSAPHEIGLPDPDEEAKSDVTQSLLSNESTDKSISNESEPISFWRAFMLPGVIAYSAAYACLKLVNYSIFFWLPYYLTSRFQWPEEVAGQVATWYDWGGIIGGILAGVLSDWLGRRTPIVMGQLIFSVVALGVYPAAPNDKLVAGLLMGVAGFFASGAANLISAAVSADLGRQRGVQGNSKALSTVTGIVDGTGSIGAALGQVLIPVFQSWLGWNSVFYMFMVMIVLTGVCLAKLCWKEIKDVKRNWRRRYTRLDAEDFD